MKKFQTVDEYINNCPTDVQAILEKIRQIIHQTVQGVEETISYQMPTFMLNGQKLIYFAAWKKHISLYPFTSEMESEIKESTAYNTSGKGTIQFPLDKPIPQDLIKKIVQFRMKEIQSN